MYNEKTGDFYLALVGFGFICIAIIASLGTIDVSNQIENMRSYEYYGSIELVIESQKVYSNGSIARYVGEFEGDTFSFNKNRGNAYDVPGTLELQVYKNHGVIVVTEKTLEDLENEYITFFMIIILSLIISLICHIVIHKDETVVAVSYRGDYVSDMQPNEDFKAYAARRKAEIDRME